jgi:long-chain acyl-CoA synthetase
MAVQSAVAQLWLQKTGCPICEGYGLSETSPSVSCNPVTSTEFSGTIGVPLPSTWMKLVDDEGREVTTLGERGEVAIKGPQVMAAYWQRPDETAKVFTADGYFRTGDIGTMDERGYFKIVDRKKDMVLVSGFNVYPNEVEDVVSNCPGVLEPDRAGRARLLPRQPHGLQAAPRDRVPDRTAQDPGGQDPAPGAARQQVARAVRRI